MRKTIAALAADARTAEERLLLIAGELRNRPTPEQASKLATEIHNSVLALRVVRRELEYRAGDND